MFFGVTLWKNNFIPYLHFLFVFLDFLCKHCCIYWRNLRLTFGNDTYPNKLDFVCVITIISKHIFNAIPTWICIFCLHVGKKFRERLQENNIHTLETFFTTNRLELCRPWRRTWDKLFLFNTNTLRLCFFLVHWVLCSQKLS